MSSTSAAALDTTCLLHLPDELLIRCCAGAGGHGIAAASVACTRLLSLGKRLKQLPVFSSALSTNASLQHAIKEAADRAMTGCFGAVDFALVFVANYGHTRHKKYKDPADVGHAVHMLRDVLGEDPLIVGCACAGVMGVGADSMPVEVDPLANSYRGRREAAARKKHGLPALPTKGVAVLLGKLPPGCVARGFAQEAVRGPTEPIDPESSPLTWDWPDFTEALALTASQQTLLLQQLQQQAATTTATKTQGTTVQPAAGAAGAHVSNSNSAVAEQLLSVVAAAAAAAAEAAEEEEEAEQQRGLAEGTSAPAEDVELVPQLCLLLYDHSLQSFGYTESAEMDRALRFMAARGVKVVGGAPSSLEDNGSGDVFFSLGANALANRLTAEPCASPQTIGLMLCTARASAAAMAALSGPAATSAAAAAPAGSSAAAAAAAAAEGAPPASSRGSEAAAAANAADTTDAGVQGLAGLSSYSALRTATMSTMGLGPRDSAPLFTELQAKMEYSHALSEHHVMVKLDIHKCNVITPPPPPPPAAAASTTTADDAAAAEQQDPAAAAADAAVAMEVGAEAAAGASVAGSSSSGSGTEAAPLRRSARLAAAPAGPPFTDNKAAAAAAAAAGGAAPEPPLTPVQHLYAALAAVEPIAGDEDGHFMALWLCPNGSSPQPFSGIEEQMVVCELLAADFGPDIDCVKLKLAVPISSFGDLRRLLVQPPPQQQQAGGSSSSSSLCLQAVNTNGIACARSLRSGVAELLPLVQAGGGSSRRSAMQDCYDALVRTAAAAGARSGLQGITVCSCTGRGQVLYTDDDFGALDGPAASSICEATLIDAVCHSSVPFVGVYVSGELGPEVDNMCYGWCRPAAPDDQQQQGSVTPSEMQAFTSMFAAWGCEPGVA